MIFFDLIKKIQIQIIHLCFQITFINVFIMLNYFFLTISNPPRIVPCVVGPDSLQTQKIPICNTCLGRIAKLQSHLPRLSLTGGNGGAPNVIQAQDVEFDPDNVVIRGTQDDGDDDDSDKRGDIDKFVKAQQLEYSNIIHS